MSKTLKSNWMNGGTQSPTVFRAASKGKPFTRNEKVKMINDEEKLKKNLAFREELILMEKAKIKEARERRLKVMEGIALRLSDSKAKLKASKDGVFLQSRNEKGHYLPKVNL